MKKPLFTAVAAATLIAVSAAPAPAVTIRAPLVLAASGRGIAGQYIVTLKPGVSIGATVSKHGIKTMFRYGRVLNGFAAKLTSRKLAKLRRAAGVARIERDAVVHAGATQRNPPSWGGSSPTPSAA
ncbi:protease inhibitor I9 family protein [Actinomadura coerulea]|uniref:protease inhibitor I9 family protein n=1 Tax=Actinomadura coerulea TaxID=46159 RepID=UPI0034464937